MPTGAHTHKPKKKRKLSKIRTSDGIPGNLLPWPLQQKDQQNPPATVNECCCKKFYATNIISQTMLMLHVNKVIKVHTSSCV